VRGIYPPPFSRRLTVGPRSHRRTSAYSADDGLIQELVRLEASVSIKRLGPYGTPANSKEIPITQTRKLCSPPRADNLGRHTFARPRIEKFVALSPLHDFRCRSGRES
jgi:hypothetical protein